jgi:NADH:ubiquinone oxidoreductase subunit 3 (subunit A)
LERCKETLGEKVLNFGLISFIGIAVWISVLGVYFYYHTSHPALDGLE